MNQNSLQTKNGLPPRWCDALARAGFVANGEGYHHEGITFQRQGRWLQLESVSHAAPPGLQRDLGRPGLWKRIGEGSVRRRVFEFPATAVCFDDESDWSAEAANLSLDAFLAWAVASAKDETVPGWQTPTRALIESWLPHGALTVQAGPFVRQGELILSPERWAVHFPILPFVPADLPAVRSAWLTAVLGDAQTLWRLVRVGFAGMGGDLAVVAEVDFTGAPPSENLFLAGVHGVRHVVAALAETVEVLADATIASQALALGPMPNPQPERSHTS